LGKRGTLRVSYEGRKQADRKDEGRKAKGEEELAKENVGEEPFNG